MPERSHPRFSAGWFSAVASVTLGAMGLGAVLCLWFPAILTTPELRDVYDMRLIRARITESNNLADRTLYAHAEADQLLNIWALVPLLFVLNLGCAFSIRRWPDLFIARAGHIWLISIQLASFIVYLIYIGRYFKAIAPLLLRSREGAGEQ